MIFACLLITLLYCATLTLVSAIIILHEKTTNQQMSRKLTINTTTALPGRDESAAAHFRITVTALTESWILHH